MSSLAVDDSFRQLPQRSSHTHALGLQGWLHGVASIEVQAAHGLHLWMGSTEDHACCCLLLQENSTRFVIQCAKMQDVCVALYSTEVACSDSTFYKDWIFQYCVLTQERDLIKHWWWWSFYFTKITHHSQTLKDQSKALNASLWSFVEMSLLWSGLASKISRESAVQYASTVPSSKWVQIVRCCYEQANWSVKLESNVVMKLVKNHPPKLMQETYCLVFLCVKTPFNGSCIIISRSV